MQGMSGQLRGRGANREADAHAETGKDSDGAEIQDAVAATDAHDEAALGEDHAHRPGFGLHRRREAACEQRKKAAPKKRPMIASHGRFFGAAFFALFACGLASPVQAETGAVRVVFTKGGFIVGVGSGNGVLYSAAIAILSGFQA